MSRGVFLKLSLVIGLGVILAVEGYYAYLFYQTPASGEVADGPETETGTAPSGGAGGFDYAFVHRAAPDNTSANSTYLDIPSINGDPEAIISVTQDWNPGGRAGTYNAHPVGVWYDAERGRWAIFNQDRSPMPEGASFNVVVLGDSTGGN